MSVGVIGRAITWGVSGSAASGTAAGLALRSASAGFGISAVALGVVGCVVVALWIATLRHGERTGCYPHLDGGHLRFESVPSRTLQAVQMTLFEDGWRST
jgi:hypothetical protein